ncbi:hypothetical protein P8452_48794 [Trifolium repens]|nr:hypothetical protein P8452_48794 [Trifolium repens]
MGLVYRVVHIHSTNPSSFYNPIRSPREKLSKPLLLFAGCPSSHCDRLPQAVVIVVVYDRHSVVNSSGEPYLRTIQSRY